MDGLEEIRKGKIEEIEKKMKNRQTKIKIEVNDSNFEEKVIRQSKEMPVIVDFWAEWCMPCLILGPILEKIADEYAGKLLLAKLDVDKNPKTTQRYGIMSIPAVKIFRNGKVADEFIGALPESQVRNCINKNLND